MGIWGLPFPLSCEDWLVLGLGAQPLARAASNNSIQCHSHLIVFYRNWRIIRQKERVSAEKKLAETEPHVISARTLPSKKFKCFKFGIWHHCAAFDLEQCCQIATHKQTTVKNDSEHWIRWDSSWEYCRPCEIWRGTRRWWSPSGQRTSRTMSRWCSPARTRARTASRRSTPPASCSTRPMEACISEIHQR